MAIGALAWAINWLRGRQQRWPGILLIAGIGTIATVLIQEFHHRVDVMVILVWAVFLLGYFIATEEGSMVRKVIRTYEPDKDNDKPKENNRPLPKDDEHHDVKQKLIGAIREIKEFDQTILLPDPIRDRYHDVVVVARGRDNSVMLYTPAEWEKIEGGLEGVDVRRQVMYKMAGATEVEIIGENTIILPDFLFDYLNTDARLTFAFTTEGIMLRESECACDTPYCAKCLSKGCKDLMCSVHTPKKKINYYSKRSDDTSRSKEEVALLKKLHK